MNKLVWPAHISDNADKTGVCVSCDSTKICNAIQWLFVKHGIIQLNISETDLYIFFKEQVLSNVYKGVIHMNMLQCFHFLLHSMILEAYSSSCWPAGVSSGKQRGASYLCQLLLLSCASLSFHLFLRAHANYLEIPIPQIVRLKAENSRLQCCLLILLMIEISAHKTISNCHVYKVETKDH